MEVSFAVKKMPQLSDIRDDAAPDDAAPDDAAPDHAAPDDAVPEHARHDGALADERSPGNAPPGVARPEPAASADSAPVADDASAGKMPGGLPPAGEASGGLAPAGRAPGGLPPAGEAPGGQAPAEEAPAGQAPGEPPLPGEAPGGRATGGAGKRSPKKPGRGPARRFARERVLQALYQWDLAAAESSTVRREFVQFQDMSRVDVDYFERLFKGISHDVERVDEPLAAALDRPLADVDPIERAVLRIATFELVEVLETPARVIINEGVEITKRFGADNGHRYVNGVLDKLAKSLRPLEMRRG